MNLSLGGREGGAATLRRTLHEPWQHLFRFCMLLSSTMHQPTYGSIMICWTKVRCLNKFYLTSIRAQAYFVVVWTRFSAYMLSFYSQVCCCLCTSHSDPFLTSGFQWPRPVDTFKMHKWTLPLGWRKFGPATLRRMPNHGNTFPDPVCCAAFINNASTNIW